MNYHKILCFIFAMVKKTQRNWKKNIILNCQKNLIQPHCLETIWFAMHWIDKKKRVINSKSIPTSFSFFILTIGSLDGIFGKFPLKIKIEWLNASISMSITCVFVFINIWFGNKILFDIDLNLIWGRSLFFGLWRTTSWCENVRGLQLDIVDQY